MIHDKYSVEQGYRMLTIRRAQMAAFERRQQHAFETKLIHEIATVWPERYGGQEAESLRKMVRAGIREGEKYGITSERDVFRWIGILCACGPGFENRAEYAGLFTILERTGVPAAERLDEILSRLSQQTPVASE